MNLFWTKNWNGVEGKIDLHSGCSQNLKNKIEGLGETVFFDFGDFFPVFPNSFSIAHKHCARFCRFCWEGGDWFSNQLLRISIRGLSRFSFFILGIKFNRSSFFLFQRSISLKLFLRKVRERVRCIGVSLISQRFFSQDQFCNFLHFLFFMKTLSEISILHMFTLTHVD